LSIDQNEITGGAQIMAVAMMDPEIDRSALIIVDIQNDFVHPDGGFARIAREIPGAGIDIPFVMGTIPHAKRLADAFREAGRPVISIAHALNPDCSDASVPIGGPGFRRATTTPLSSRALRGRGSWTI
jgi:nicotinamidase-related amidase